MADINTIFKNILESQRDINTHIHELNPTTPIILYEIDLNEIQPITIKFGENSIFNDGVIRIHNDYNLFNINRGIVIWKGKAYYPFPIFGEGFDITSNGTIPTPKIKFSSQFLEDQYNSFYKYVRMQMNQLKDIVGAKVTRRKTFLRYLRGDNFLGGINPFNEYDDTPWATRDGDTLTIKTNESVSSNCLKWIVYYYKPIQNRNNGAIFFSIKSIFNDKLLKQSQDSSFFSAPFNSAFFTIEVNSQILNDIPDDNPIFYQDVFIIKTNPNNFSNFIYKNENEFTLNNSSNKLKFISNIINKKFNNENNLTITYPVSFSNANNLATFISVASSGQEPTNSLNITENQFVFQQIQPAPLTKTMISGQNINNFNVRFSNNLSGEYLINYATFETGYYTGTNPDTNENVKLLILKQDVNFGSNTTGQVSITYPTTFDNYQPKILFNSFNKNENKFDFITELRNITNSGFEFYASGISNLNSHTFNFLATDYQPEINSPTGITQTFSNFFNNGNRFAKDFGTELIESKNTSNTEVELTPDVFYIDRKTQEDSTNAVYELASLLDIEGVKLPARVLLSQNCPFQYRGEGCLYEYNSRLTEAHSGIYGQIKNIIGISSISGSATNELLCSKDTSLPIKGVNEYNKIYGLQSAPPVADSFNNTFSGTLLQDRNIWGLGQTYTSGNFVYLTKNGLNYYFVCKTNHLSNSINSPPNTGYWAQDACSKTLQGCRLRWKNNFNFPLVTNKYFMETIDFQTGNVIDNSTEEIISESIRAPKDKDGNSLLGFLPFGGFPSVEGRFRNQQSSQGQ